MRWNEPGVNYWDAPQPFPGLFVNYRKPDAYAAVFLDSLAVEVYGDESVFLASRSIAPGRNFEEALINGSKRASAMLVVIGRDWANSLNRGEHDWTLREIVTAQECGAVLLPVFLINEGVPEPRTPSLWPNDAPYEALNADTLPVGIDRQLLSVEGVPFGARCPGEDFRDIVAALAALAPELRPLDGTV